MLDLEVVERPTAVYSHQRVQVCMAVTWDGAVVLLDPSPWSYWTHSQGQ